MLVGPGGQDLILVGYVGENGAPGHTSTGVSNVTLTLDDAASAQLAASSPWGAPNSSVTAKPTNAQGFNYTFPAPAPSGPYENPGPAFGGSATLGSTFDGTSADGTWSLYVITTGGSGVGTGSIAGGWCLGVTTPKVNAPTTSSPDRSAIPIGNTNLDSATIAGHTGFDPTGTVTFGECGPLTSATGCTGSGTALGSAVTVTPGVGGESSASSSTFTPQSLGTYCFVASYAGDVNYNPTSDASGADECFTVGQAVPGVSSTPVNSNISLGASNSDDVTVAGNAVAGSPTGTVSFHVCGPLTSASGCATGGTPVGSSVSVTGAPNNSSTATSAGFTAPSPGTYCFRADYSGATDYTAASDAASDECFTVAQATPGTTSTPGSASTALGAHNTDAATITGNGAGGSPTGTVSFSVCGPLASASGCATGGTAVGSPVTVTTGSGNTATATSAAFTPTSPGIYCFRADYSGDSNYNAASDGSGADECFTVGKTTPGTTSAPGSASIALGQTNSDGVTMTGNSTGGSPGGTVSFSVCGPLASASGCATGGMAVGTSIGLAAGAGDTATATSAAFTPTSVGTYCFRADYSGDGNYVAASDGSGADECFTVGPATPTISSSPTSSNIVLGISNTDNVTLAGNAVAGSPSGTVTFSVCGPLASASGCATGGTAVGSAVSLTAGAADTATATSAAFTPTSAGTYCFRADYSGDTNYNPASDASGADECFTVGRATPAVSSSPVSSNIVLGSANTDNVTLAGNAVAGSPSGTVTFSVCGPLTSAGGCATGGTTVGGAVSVAGGPNNSATASSAGFTAPTPGTYCFRASYGGDGNYVAGSDASGSDECFTVAPPPANVAPGALTAPSVSLVTPANGATYTQGAKVDASYSCQEGAGGPGLLACKGSVADGAVVSTAKPGSFTFTAVATSADGLSTTATAHYTVRPSNHFTVAHLHAHHNGSITLHVKVPGPGTLDLLVTAWDGNVARIAVLNPAPRRFAYARKHVLVKRGETVPLKITPNGRGKLLLAHHAYRIVLRVWVTYTPSGGVAASQGFRGIHLR